MAEKDYTYLVNNKYSMLTVVEYLGVVNGRKKVKVQCDCGQEKIIRVDAVGTQISCGCFINPKVRIGTSLIDGRSKEKLYNVYYTMKARLYNKNCKEYKYYGGKGIKMCNEWKDYIVFKKWAFENGYREGLTIERNKVNEDYCPENCSWETMKVQCQNRTNSRLINHNGIFKTLRQWSDDLGLNYKKQRWQIYRRFKKTGEYKLSTQ